MPGGRPIDSYRDGLAKRAGIPREKTRKLSISHLEHLVRLGETERNLLIRSPGTGGRRFGTPMHMRKFIPLNRRNFVSRKWAQNVAIILQRITGEECTVSVNQGKFTVTRHCTGGKLKTV